jgi:hypothetical protein
LAATHESWNGSNFLQLPFEGSDIVFQDLQVTLESGVFFLHCIEEPLRTIAAHVFFLNHRLLMSKAQD